MSTAITVAIIGLAALGLGGIVLLLGMCKIASDADKRMRDPDFNWPGRLR